MGGGSFTEPREGTNRDIRFTRSKDNTVLYATVLGWPGATLDITTLGANRINLGSLVSARLLNPTAGSYTDLPNRSQDGTALHLTMPSSTPPFAAPAYVVKLTFSGQIPALASSPVSTSWARITNATTGLVLDGGGDVGSGSILKQWSWDSSTNLQWQLVGAGSGYVRIVNRTNGMVADSWGDTTNGAPVRQAPWNGGTSSGGSTASATAATRSSTAAPTPRWTAWATRPQAPPAPCGAPNSSPNNHWTITTV
ncbi:RICIN domain-containing protein [Actinosynnema sp. NPDC050801]|uniref:RICIN domain-containing protein n=1 Tax=unclassified Actinosynnema TaxID=2637065 RepID=UPI0033C847C7